mmetsp:Transcript_151612/g.486509  ORF Transcript_151612/g.486509 Transcript_151612/m.486509 type:complete len:212 (+) Transcript_151612:125-760(+)
MGGGPKLREASPSSMLPMPTALNMGFREPKSAEPHAEFWVAAGFLDSKAWLPDIMCAGNLVCIGATVRIGPAWEAWEPKIEALIEDRTPPSPPWLSIGGKRVAIAEGAMVSMCPIWVAMCPAPPMPGPPAPPPNIVDITPEAMADSPQYIAGVLLGEPGCSVRRSSLSLPEGGVGDIGQRPPPPEAADVGAGACCGAVEAGAEAEVPMPYA